MSWRRGKEVVQRDGHGTRGARGARRRRCELQMRESDTGAVEGAGPVQHEEMRRPGQEGPGERKGPVQEKIAACGQVG